jgi:hypothetical protein
MSKRSILFLAVIFILAGCSKAPNSNSELAVFAGIAKFGPISDQVVVSIKDGDKYITNAVVSVNGTNIASIGSIYLYIGNLAIVSGDEIILKIKNDSINLTETNIVPAKPVITSPTSNASPYNSGNPIAVEWNSIDPVPDGITIIIDSDFKVSSNNTNAVLPGTANSYTIPGGTLISGGSNIIIQVQSVNFKILSGFKLG